MATVTITKVSETHIKVDADHSVLRELWNHFSYEHPRARFTPAYKNRGWDGRIRLLNFRSRQMLLGLHKLVVDYCKNEGYDVIYQDSIDSETSFSVEEFNRLVAALKLSAMNDGVRETIIPHDYQERGVIHAIQSNRTLLLSATACHPPGTKVLMYDGTFKSVENVCIGDQLMGVDSTPRNVLDLHHGQDLMYTVVPKDNTTTFGVNENHMLSLVNSQSKHTSRREKDGDITNITVKDYLKSTKWFKQTHKLYRLAQPLVFKNASPIPVDPYFLGVLLGDGTLLGSVGVTTMDSKIVDMVYQQAHLWGLNIRIRTEEGNQAKTYYLTSNNHCNRWRVGSNSLINTLRELGVFGHNSGNKFIPNSYKTSTPQERLELLAGLIDTDGHLSNGSSYEYVTKSKVLSSDVEFLCGTLGFKFTTTPKIVGGTIYYRTHISGSIERIPVRLDRKCKIIYTRKNPMRTGFDIIPQGIGDFYGFELDGDHLYLLDNFVVTHNSGKSLMLYILMRYYLAKTKGKILIIVPTTSLVRQLHDDFVDYAHYINFNVPETCHMIYDGGEKHTEKRVVISTWQALAVKERLPKEIQDEMKHEYGDSMAKKLIKQWNKQAPYILDNEYFKEFQVVFGDEAHLFSAEDSQGDGELQKIMNKLVNAKYRIGTTGTLKDAKVHHMVLEGIFGKVYEVISTRDMIDQKKAADLTIKCLQLQYPDSERRWMRKKTYQEEMDFLLAHKNRNKFICNLALSLPGNTLVLFERVEKHGKVLNEMLAEKVAEGRKLFYIHGKTPTDDRNEVRRITEGETNAIIVASYGTFSVGVNIRNINNIIFASPTKAKVRVLQSIGRGLRLSKRKTEVTLFDISDDFSGINKAGHITSQNYSLQHFVERVNFYNRERHPYKLYKILIEATE